MVAAVLCVGWPVTHKGTWKRREREQAGFFGAKRVPLSGSNSGHNTSSDSLHPTIYLECKHRAKHSAITLWDDTAAKAKAEGKVPVVAMSEKGRQGFWLLVHSSDLNVVADCHTIAEKKKAAAEVCGDVCAKCGGTHCLQTVMGWVCRGDAKT